MKFSLNIALFHVSSGVNNCIDWDIAFFRSVARHKVDAHHDLHARKWNNKRGSEDGDESWIMWVNPSPLSWMMTDQELPQRLRQKKRASWRMLTSSATRRNYAE
jgi:hypothetical protein